MSHGGRGRNSFQGWAGLQSYDEIIQQFRQMPGTLRIAEHNIADFGDLPCSCQPVFNDAGCAPRQYSFHAFLHEGWCHKIWLQNVRLCSLCNPLRHLLYRPGNGWSWDHKQGQQKTAHSSRLPDTGQFRSESLCRKESPVTVCLRARVSSTQFALLSWRSATGGTADNHRQFGGRSFFHDEYNATKLRPENGQN
jgi:hypothetical protein